MTTWKNSPFSLACIGGFVGSLAGTAVGVLLLMVLLRVMYPPQAEWPVSEWYTQYFYYEDDPLHVKTVVTHRDPRK